MSICSWTWTSFPHSFPHPEYIRYFNSAHTTFIHYFLPHFLDVISFLLSSIMFILSCNRDEEEDQHKDWKEGILLKDTSRSTEPCLTLPVKLDMYFNSLDIIKLGLRSSWIIPFPSFLQITKLKEMLEMIGQKKLLPREEWCYSYSSSSVRGIVE